MLACRPVRLQFWTLTWPQRFPWNAVPFLLYYSEIWAKQANLNVTDEKNYVRYSLKKSSNLSVHVYVNTFKRGLSNV